MMERILKQTRRPDITFCRNGRIFICARIARILALNKGDSINIALKDGEYLLFARKNNVGRHKAACHPTKSRSHNFCANSVQLARAVLSASGISGPRGSFMAGDPVKIQDITYCPIITRKPL